MPPVVLSTERSAASAYPLEDPRKGELAEPAQKAVAGDAGGAKDFLSLVFGDAVASWAALVDAVAAANGLVSAEGLRAALRIAVEQDHSASMTESFQLSPDAQEALEGAQPRVGDLRTAGTAGTAARDRPGRA